MVSVITSSAAYGEWLETDRGGGGADWSGERAYIEKGYRECVGQA